MPEKTNLRDEAWSTAGIAGGGSTDVAMIPAPKFDAPSIPSTPLERYQVMCEIGRGGMGLVYKARDTETGEMLALKVLKPEISGDAELFELFVNEMRLARKITHRNVCRIYDFTRLGGSACISMEYVEGESLRQVGKRFGTLSPKKAVEIMRQICAGLREAHNQGIIHRDLKPDNVMLDPHGNVKLMDFGIARVIGRPDDTTTDSAGTPAYMAPEQFTGRPLDHRADIYALGLILYEMLTGVPAFSGHTTVALIQKHLHELPALPGSHNPMVPRQLERLILKCLEKEPNRRFQSVEELLLALEAKPEPRVYLAASQAKAWMLTGGLFAASALVAFGFGWQLRPTEAPQVRIAPPPAAVVSAPARPASPYATSAGGTVKQSVPSRASAPRIARNSEELGQLQRSGAAAYYEFGIAKSRDYSIAGPVLVRLNKVDVKRQLYTVTVRMDDNNVELRDRALFEPVEFYHAGSRHQVELVVFKIENDRVEGYLTAPRSVKPLDPATQPAAQDTRRSPLSKLVSVFK